MPLFSMTMPNQSMLGCVMATHLRPTLSLLGLLALLLVPLAAQEADYVVYTDAPRLLLNGRRLKLMQRERERESMRWMQFESLMAGKAVMPEPGFASALYGVVTARREACRAAGAWAQSADPARDADARQMALVYDWCLEALDGAQANALARRLSPLLAERPATFERARSVAFAAIALADQESKASQQALKNLVEGYWQAKVKPALTTGDAPFPDGRALFAMMEFLHAIRDNLRIDLREGAEKWFEELAPRQVLNYYPLPWPAPENLYRIPAYAGGGEPDLALAALSRAAELALVAFDTNSQPNQFLQGWLMMDRYLMRGTFGAPYELLWANPYQPGLSYTYLPELFHARGQIIARSSWEDDAVWFSYRPGAAQAFQNGRRLAVDLNARLAPVQVGPVKIFFPPDGMRLETGWLAPPEPDNPRPGEEYAFVVGLDPNSIYDVEADDREMEEARTDSGGILALRFPAGQKLKVRVKKAAPLAQ